MAHNEGSHLNSKKHVKLWMYVVALLLNVAVFTVIGLVYNSSVKSYSEKLTQENVHLVETLNTSFANAAYSYTTSLGVKADDLVRYITEQNLDYDEAVAYLGAANSETVRQFQLVKSGVFDAAGAITYGDYSGVSIRVEDKGEGVFEAVTNDISYANGYEEILRFFSDTIDGIYQGVCLLPEFTDPDTKQKHFAAYRHIVLTDAAGTQQIYTLLVAVSTQTAMEYLNLQSEFAGQSTVLINTDGDYIVKSEDFRNTNFFDYLVNYNGLASDWRTHLQEEISAGTTQIGASVNLYYVNYQGEPCIFSVVEMENGWYSVTCVPLSSFNQADASANYALVILLLFLFLFLMDGLAISLVWRAMKRNVAIAEQATQAANDASQAKSRFLSTMSHELRTPLNAITGLVALSEDSLDNPSLLKDYLGKINIASKLLLQLISDILDMSAIESNKLKLNMSEFDLSQLLESLVVVYYDQCATKGIAFNTTFKDIPGERLIGDATRLNQVLLNFLSNAVKFTAQGGEVKLYVEQVRREGNVALIRFVVSDNGCGISEELRPRLFNPFERASGDAARKYGGTGLGLSIAKSVVELMGGSITVESVESIGSSFCAEIPFRVSSHVIEQVPPKHPAHYNLLGRRVLLVEDNMLNTEIACELLKKVGVETETVENGQRGFERFVASDPGYYDAILMDIQMPVMNGYEASAAIRASSHPQARDIPILAMTADAFAEDIEKAHAAGMNEHISKPVEPANMFEILTKAIASSQHEDQEKA